MQHSMVLAEVSTTMRMMAAGGSKCGMNCFPLLYCLWLQNMPTYYSRPPWVFKMERFQEKKEKSKDWFSDPVYSHFGGYKMCLHVDANEYGSGKHTHVSAYIYLMQGDNDGNLKWSFIGTI